MMETSVSTCLCRTPEGRSITRSAARTSSGSFIPSGGGWATFFADLAGEHAVTFARSSGHPGLVEDALLPSFDQLHQVQVRLGETRSLQNREQIIRSQGRTHS